jgi:hypothetical protein
MQKGGDTMYTVQQLQALDYLLKRITKENSYRLFQKNLKFVVDLNHSFWYGDFIEMNGLSVVQLFIDDLGEIERDTLSPAAVSPLKQIWDSYIAAVKSNSPFWSNPFKNMENLPLLFDTLIKILNQADLGDAPSPFYPYLLNAKSLDGKMELPFINLAGERIKLVSIIEI